METPEKSKSALARAKAKALSERQAVALASEVELLAKWARGRSEHLDAYLATPRSQDELRALLENYSKQEVWIAEKLLDLAALIKSGRFRVTRRRGRPLSDREKKLAFAEQMVRRVGQDGRARKKRGEKPPEIVDLLGDRKPKPLTREVMIALQVKYQGDRNRFDGDVLTAQLAGERRPKYRSRNAAAKRRRKK